MTDTIPPVITLNGDAVINLNVGDTYEELGDGTNTTKYTPNFVVCPVTSLLNVEHNEFNEFKIYPNPFRNKFSINIASNATFSISDITGKKLKTQSISTGITQIDMENYSAGIYFISITDGTSLVNRKIIKQ